MLLSSVDLKKKLLTLMRLTNHAFKYCMFKYFNVLNLSKISELNID